ncbi:hypothetical protein KCU65_g3276, partial [Aureobasidium melanogenum]
MGAIGDLRTQILDNIRVLYPNFRPDSRFVLTCDVDDGPEKWTVVLGVPAAHRPCKYSVYYNHGKGDSPEAAYKDLLRNTALELDGLGYSWD